MMYDLELIGYDYLWRVKLNTIIRRIVLIDI